MSKCCEKHSTKFCPDCGRRIRRNGEGPGAKLVVRLDRTLQQQRTMRSRWEGDSAHCAERRASIDATIAELTELRAWVQKHVDAEAASLATSEGAHENTDCDAAAAA
jgi:hypothetical protein